jgi:glyoxylase-like metal-dependent hydrolase (beta-lactamase superfamily II)
VTETTHTKPGTSRFACRRTHHYHRARAIKWQIPQDDGHTLHEKAHRQRSGEQVMNHSRGWVLALIVFLGTTALWIQESRGALAQGGPSHRMTKITDTIYRADNPGTPGINATSWVFINDDDVLVTDSEGSPASARSLLAGVATITSKPVRYLVDTHFHIDHAYGNAALPSTIQIIGSEFTRRMLLGPEARQGVTFRNFTDPIPSRIANLKERIATEPDPQRKATLQTQLTSQEATLAVYSGNFPLQPPSVTVTTSISIWSGSKEFKIMWIGRAHTAGDVVVYVPSEKAVASGDIVFKAMVGWQGDAFPNEHPATLDALKKLDLELLLPGHGDHIQGRANIDAAIATMQGYLREEWRQAADAKQQRLTPEDALKRMDLSRFGDAYRNDVVPSLAAVRRMYDIMDGKAETN